MAKPIQYCKVKKTKTKTKKILRLLLKGVQHGVVTLESSLSILFNNFIYLWLHCFVQDFFSCLKKWASHSGGFSCFGAQAVGCTGSVVVAHRLCCPVACGIFPDHGSNLCPLHGRQILNHWTIIEVQKIRL